MSYLYLCASVAKQYNLVQVKRQLHSEVEKATVGLATHWPRITDFVILIYGLEANKMEMGLCSQKGVWYHRYIHGRYGASDSHRMAW